MNIPIVNVYRHDGDGSEEARQDKVNYVLQVGTLSSALEHAIPEQMFATPQASVLPNIHHDSLVMNEISNALNTGRDVITHMVPQCLLRQLRYNCFRCDL